MAFDEEIILPPQIAAELEAVREWRRALTPLSQEQVAQSPPLPEGLRRVLVEALGALLAGEAILVRSCSTSLTTVQVAELLGVSRPAVLRLLQAGQLSGDHAGRGAVRLEEVVRYLERRRSRQRKQYRELIAEDGALPDPHDERAAQEHLRKIRSQVAEEWAHAPKAT